MADDGTTFHFGGSPSPPANPLPLLSLAASRGVAASGAATAMAAQTSELDHRNPLPSHNRDDAWSEGATFVLIDAWGERYLHLNRGNLKQKHWRDVADAVNRRGENKGVPKSSKTDVQCKNRLDTLKKKYKIEKSRILGEGGVSKWPFFPKLDDLIGPSKKGKKLISKVQRRDENNVNSKGQGQNHSDSSKDSADLSDSYGDEFGNGADDPRVSKKRKLHDGGPFKDLARAILKFGEAYERIESSKQQQLMELEKQRMEFTKDLELQRMNIFMQTQMELAKMKHGKHGNTEHYL